MYAPYGVIAAVQRGVRSVERAFVHAGAARVEPRASLSRQLRYMPRVTRNHLLLIDTIVRRHVIQRVRVVVGARSRRVAMATQRHDALLAPLLVERRCWHQGELR